MQEAWVQSLGWEDTLEKEMATCSSILAWKIPWTEEPMNLQRVGHNWVCTHCPAPNMGVEISLRDPAFSSVRYVPSSGIPALCGNCTSNFWVTAVFPLAAAPFYIPINIAQVLIFGILANTFCFLFFVVPILILWSGMSL